MASKAMKSGKAITLAGIQKNLLGPDCPIKESSLKT